MVSQRISFIFAFCLLFLKFKALTPTILGRYIHHNCERLAYYNLLPDEDPRKPAKEDPSPRLMQWGLEHEAKVLEWYYNQGLQVVEVKGTDAVEQVRELIREGKADVIYQAYLYPTDLFRAVHIYLPVMIHGYPDLLKKRRDKTTPGGHTFYEVGDIKASLQPKLYQKYQVTLYSHLLYYLYQDLYPDEAIPYPDRGFIVPLSSLQSEVSSPESGLYVEEHFDLEPFRYALEDAFQEIARLLTKDAQEIAWHLDSKCQSCGYFKHCREEARTKEDLSLIPFLRRSQKRRLLRDGIETVSQAAIRLDPSSYQGDWALSRSVKQIQLHAQALKENRIIPKNPNPESELIPHNIGVEIYVNVETDPVQKILYLYGLLVRELGYPDRLETFLAHTSEDERKVFEQFLTSLYQVWKSCGEQKKVAHIFWYDNYEKRQLQRVWEKYDWEYGSEEDIPSSTPPHPHTPILPELQAFLYQILFSEEGHCTNLHDILQQTLALPVESSYILPKVARVLNYPGPIPQWLQDHETISLYWQAANPAERNLYYAQILDYITFSLQAVAHIYQYLKSNITWVRTKEPITQELLPMKWASSNERSTLKGKLLTFLRTESDLKIQEIREFQRLPLQERVARYRCIARLKYREQQILPSGEMGYVFSYGPSGVSSKFRENEYLKLRPMDEFKPPASSKQRLWEGQNAILVQNDPRNLRLVLKPLRGQLLVDSRILYNLEEDLNDITFDRASHAINRAFSNAAPFNFLNLLHGNYGTKENNVLRDQALAWMVSMAKVLDFDNSQGKAFLLPFTYDLSLIQGPPGTGKTYVLAWILLAQIILAQRNQRPMRILISAASHKAINNVLRKVASHLNQFMGGQMICPLYKISSGGNEAEELNPGDGPVQVYEIRRGNRFPSNPYYILGATPQGVYRSIKDKNYFTTGDPFESIFDLVVFDEASQITIPLALIVMLCSKGKFVFVGDENQMSPIVQGAYPEDEYYHRSIFEYLKRQDGYRPCTVMLIQTRRMNRDLTEFPSQTFYYNQLKPHSGNAELKLPSLLNDKQQTPDSGSRTPDRLDDILDPSKPVILIETQEEFSQQRNLLEVQLVVDLTRRLILEYQIPPRNMAVIAPHRAQNNEITHRLAELFQTNDISLDWLPLVDTVERIQGQERDVILISLTASDPDYILAESDFLLSPNRLNVALTRAVRKLIVIGSQTVFRVRPEDESLLKRAMILKKFRRFCERKNAIIFLEDEVGAG